LKNLKIFIKIDYIKISLKKALNLLLINFSIILILEKINIDFYSKVCYNVVLVT